MTSEQGEQGANGPKSLQRLPFTSCIYKGLMTGSVSLKIHVGNITRLVGVQMIVCSENTMGSNAGTIARQLFDLGGDSYRSLKTQAFYECKGTLRIGDVVTTGGGELCYELVMHMIIPQYQILALREVYMRIFKKTSRLGVSSVAVPLLRTARGKFAPKRSISALLVELEKFSTKYQRYLEVHVVIGKENTASDVHDFVDQYVKDLWKSKYKDILEISERQRAPAECDRSKDDYRESEERRLNVITLKTKYREDDTRLLDVITVKTRYQKKQYEYNSDHVSEIRRASDRGDNSKDDVLGRRQTTAECDNSKLEVSGRRRTTAECDNSKDDVSGRRRTTAECDNSKDEVSGRRRTTAECDNSKDEVSGRRRTTAECDNRKDEVSGRRRTTAECDYIKDAVSGRRRAPAECDNSKDDLTGSCHESIKKGSAEGSLRPKTKTYKTLLSPVGNALSGKRQESAECDASKDGSIKIPTAAASLTTTDTLMPTVVKTEDKPDDCVICMDVPRRPKTLKCGHTFCNECVVSLFKIKPCCPICGKVCGMICGDQPNGSMIIEKHSSRLSGFEKHDTISMCYRFPDSQQGANHPKPGAFVRNITRIGYVPDNNEGRQVCAMLAVAFQRRLVFTIGSSRTTGEEGVITWNDIHHKTDLRPNTQFGYPDPTYLQRVREELAAKGVTEEDVKSLDKQIAKFIKKGKHGAKAIVHTHT